MFSLMNRAKETKRRNALRQAIESLESRLLLAYTLDPTFDGDWMAFGAGGAAFVVQPDNKIVAPTNGNHALRRYNVDGSVDTTFNGANNGTVSPISIQQLRLSGDKFVITDGGNVARLNANGSLDTTFGGGDGVVQIPFVIVEMLTTYNGKIVLLGARNVMNEDPSQYDHYFFDVARLNTDGSWDTSFAGDGLVEWEQNANLMGAWINAGGVQSDGKIIAAAAQTYSPMEGVESYTFRLNEDGTGDSTYDGYFDSPYSGITDVEVARDNSYFLVNNARILHLFADGSLDPAFNDNGLNLGVEDSWPKDGASVTGIGPLAAGKVLVTGYVDYKPFVARLLADGNPDSTFSGTPGGMIFLNPQDFPADAAADSLARVIVGGQTNAGGSVEANNWIARLKDAGLAQHPYNGSPFNVGQIIQAEDFDTGGEGLAYHDTDAANVSGAYRPTESVDIESSSDTGGGYDVGYSAQGEWLEYTFSIPKSAPYSIDTRVASGLSGSLFHYEVDGENRTGSIAIPNTGGWQNWTTISSNLGTLTSGTHTLRLPARWPWTDTFLNALARLRAIPRLA